MRCIKVPGHNLVLGPTRMLAAHLHGDQTCSTKLIDHIFAGTKSKDGEESAMSSQHPRRSAVASVPTLQRNATPAIDSSCLIASPLASTTTTAVRRRTGAEADAEPQACFVCMEAAADTVLIDCGHGGLCAGTISLLSAYLFIGGSWGRRDRELAAIDASSVHTSAH